MPKGYLASPQELAEIALGPRRRRKPIAPDYFGADLTAPRQPGYQPSPDLEKGRQLRQQIMGVETPKRPVPGKLGTILGILSEIFLRRDIPEELRERKYQRGMEEYQSKIRPYQQELAALQAAREEETGELGRKKEAFELGQEVRKAGAPRYETSGGRVFQLPPAGGPGEPKVAIEALGKEDLGKSELDRLVDLYGPEKGLGEYQKREIARRTAVTEIKQAGGGGMTPAQRASVVNRKQQSLEEAKRQYETDLKDLEKRYRLDPASGMYRDVSQPFAPPISKEDYQRMRDELEDRLYGKYASAQQGYEAGLSEAGEAITKTWDPLTELKRARAERGGTGAPGPQGKPLDEQTARKIMAEAGEDPERAREIARQRGYRF